MARQSGETPATPQDARDIRAEVAVLAQKVRLDAWTKVQSELARWKDLSAVDRRGLLKLVLSHTEPRTPLVEINNFAPVQSPGEVIRERLAKLQTQLTGAPEAVEVAELVADTEVFTIGAAGQLEVVDAPTVLLGVTTVPQAGHPVHGIVVDGTTEPITDGGQLAADGETSDS